jgi:hypothetical protein
MRIEDTTNNVSNTCLSGLSAQHLGGSKMSIQPNLTGEQIQQILDLFLYKAMEPVVLNSDVFDDQVSYILGLISTNRKRKPSSLPREKVINLLCTYLATEDRAEKYRILRIAHIERCFLHVFLSKFLKEFAGFLPMYRRMMLEHKPIVLRKQLDARANAISCTRHEIYRILTVSYDYIGSFYKCRSWVLDHYVKHASRQAKIHINSGKGKFDFFDVRQSILKSILLALDKYDSSKGALTSYINWWIFNAQTCNISEHEYGVAYTIPQIYRRKIACKDLDTVNYSISMDDVGGENDKNLHSIVSDKQDISRDFEQYEETAIVCYLAKCVDTMGLARLVLDVGEHFSESERMQMSRQTREELGITNCKEEL